MSPNTEELLLTSFGNMFDRGREVEKNYVFDSLLYAANVFFEGHERERISTFLKLMREIIDERENNREVGDRDRTVSQSQSGSNECTENRGSTVDGD